MNCLQIVVQICRKLTINLIFFIKRQACNVFILIIIQYICLNIQIKYFFNIINVLVKVLSLY